jgi:AhpD family alkylhydroperoxidase
MKKQSRVFSINEQISSIKYASKSFVALKKSKGKGLMNKKLKERIMLAITEVNGCSLCSFVHTKIALSSGMTREQIKEILDGNTDNIPVEDAVAIMFAQEFAYSKDKPSKTSIERIVSEYGKEKANLIKAACHMITMTNGMGTSMDYFYSRIKFDRNKDSNIFIELFNPIFTMLLFPPLVVYNVFKCMFRKSTLQLIKN